MAEVGVNRDTENFGVSLGELIDLVAELLDLSWADECEVQRVEDQQKVLALVAIKRYLLEGVLGLAPCLSLEVWRSLLDNGFHGKYLYF